MKNRLVIIADHLSTGGMPALIALEAKTRRDTEIHVFAWQNHPGSIHQNQLRALDNVSIYRYDGSNLARDKIVQRVIDLDVPFVIQHDTALGTLELQNHGIRVIRFVHSSIDVGQLLPKPDHYLVTSPIVKRYVSKTAPDVKTTIVRTAVDESMYLNAPDKLFARRQLDIPKNAFVVVHSGIWSPNKNQGAAIEIFKGLEVENKRLMLIGGQYPNYESYWRRIDTKSSEITVCGEVAGPEWFYAASDLYLSTSFMEGCPMAVREAALTGLPCVISDIPAHRICSGGSPFYFCSLENEAVEFVDTIEELAADRECLQYTGECCRCWVEANYSLEAYINQLNEIYDEYEDEREMSAVELRGIDYSLTIRNRVRMEIFSHKVGGIGLRVLGDGRYWERSVEVSPGERYWIELPGERGYYPYRFQILKDGVCDEELLLNLTGQRVLIRLDSTALGDTLAWLPAIYQFAKDHSCHVECQVAKAYTEFLNKTAPDGIRFVNGEDEYDYVYTIGCFDETNWRAGRLEDVANKLLRVTPEPIRLRVDREHAGYGYICIAPSATTKGKQWNHPNGWRTVISGLQAKGYRVVSISQNDGGTYGAEDWTGNVPLMDRACQLQDAMCLIGLSSGMSWLARAVGTHVFMINTCTYDWHEFQDNVTHIGRSDVCRGCWNWIDTPLDKGWDWCPSGKDYQCGRFLDPNEIVNAVVNYLNTTKYLSKQDREDLGY